MGVSFPLPDECLQEFDKLYVVSDLHLGGATDFQIFKAGDTFQKFVDHLRTTDPKKKVALLINGDMVDFLAEEPPMAFDPAGAVTKLTTIVKSFKPVWEALQKFVKTKNRCLLINLGNHDLELALPWVREKLLTILTDGDEAVHGRIRLVFDGTGIRCRVGKAEILALHGNEVDAWNITDYEHLRRLGRDLMLGRQVADWVPNAGSQLVIDVMNEVKRKFPFVDLLKPEKEAVLPTLLVLAPDQYDKLMAIRLFSQAQKENIFQRNTGWLGQPDLSSDGLSDAASETDILPDRLRMGMSHPDFKADLLRKTEKRFKEEVDPMTLVSRDQQGNFLGYTGALWKRFIGSDPAEVLREALEKIQNDESFNPAAEDDTFRRLDEKVGDGPTFIVAGHTHLERALPRKKSQGWYFNSGTWTRLIKLEPDVLRDPVSFKKVFQAFGGGTMATLDSKPNLVIQKLTVVHFWIENAKTFGELKHVTVSGNGLTLESVPGTRFPKS